jgi:hypothetical protein
MRYCEISKETSLLYLGLVVFCQFEARDPEFDTPPPKCSVHFALNTASKSWDSSFELAEYIKPKIQRRHLFAVLTITNLCFVTLNMRNELETFEYLRKNGKMHGEMSHKKAQKKISYYSPFNEYLG